MGRHDQDTNFTHRHHILIKQHIVLELRYLTDPPIILDTNDQQFKGQPPSSTFNLLSLTA